MAIISRYPKGSDITVMDLSYKILGNIKKIL